MEHGSPAPWVMTRENDDNGQVHLLPHASIALFSARSPFKDTDNEDAAVVIPIDERRIVAAVADGVGGHSGGADAAGIAVAALVQAVRGAAGTQSELRSAILNGIETANAQICDLGLGAATTLSVVEINGRSLRPYHVGDSVILVVGQRGKLKLETVAHSPVGYAVEAGLIDATDAMHHEDRHLVSNVVGSPDMRIEVGAVLPLDVRDTVILGSDGLFDNLHLQEIIEHFRKGSLDTQSVAVAGLVRERMMNPRAGVPSKPDDLTFVLYRPASPAGQ